MPELDDADQRLEEVGKKIDEAREHAEDAFPVLEDDEPRYVDSGETEEEDDQTAQPM